MEETGGFLFVLPTGLERIVSSFYFKAALTYLKENELTTEQGGSTQPIRKQGMALSVNLDAVQQHSKDRIASKRIGVVGIFISACHSENALGEQFPHRMCELCGVPPITQIRDETTSGSGVPRRREPGHCSRSPLQFSLG